jgi:hypothetical protein
VCDHVSQYAGYANEHTIVNMMLACILSKYNSEHHDQRFTMHQTVCMLPTTANLSSQQTSLWVHARRQQTPAGVCQPFINNMHSCTVCIKAIVQVHAANS